MKMKIHAVRPFRRSVSAALAAAFLAAGCEKPAAPGASAVKAPEAPAVAAPEAAAAYGFLAKVPADVDAVAGMWRWEELWDGFMKSRWLVELGKLSALKGDAEFQKMLKGEFPEEAQKPLAIARAVLGKEIVFVAAKGTAEKLGTLMKTANDFQTAQMRAQVSLLKTAGLNAPPDAAQAALGEALVSVLPSLEKLDAPPFYLVSAAGAARADIDEGIKQLTDKITTEPKPGLTLGTTQAGGATLQTLKLEAAALIAANEAEFSAELAKMIPDAEKAKQARAAIEKKTLEIAWGWIGDHFLLSVGPDSSHVVLAATPATSALSIPALAKTAADHAGKKLHSLSFTKAAIFDAVARPFETAGFVGPIAEMMRAQLPDGEVERMTGEAKEFDAKYAPQMKQTFTDMVGVDWWEGGLRSEISGGRKHRADAAPLELSGTLNGKTLLHINSRSEPGGLQWRPFVEDLSENVWGWYMRGVKPALPPETQMQSAIAETMGVAVIKELWKAGGLMSEALGDESALIVDTDGVIPANPALGVPASIAEKARIPRVALVYTVKNRAKLAEAWAIINGVIKQFSAFIPEGAFDKSMVEAQSRKEGAADIHWLPVIPMDTGDVLPHVAVTDTRLVFGTSPLYSAGLTGVAPASGGAPAWIHWRAQPATLADLIQTDLTAAAESPDMKEQTEQDSFKEMKADMDIITKLIRSFTKLDIRTHDESGTSKLSLTLGLEDVK